MKTVLLALCLALSLASVVEAGLFGCGRFGSRTRFFDGDGRPFAKNREGAQESGGFLSRTRFRDGDGRPFLRNN